MPSNLAAMFHQTLATQNMQQQQNGRSQLNGEVGEGTSRERLNSADLLNNKTDKCEFCGKV